MFAPKALLLSVLALVAAVLALDSDGHQSVVYAEAPGVPDEDDEPPLPIAALTQLLQPPTFSPEAVERAQPPTTPEQPRTLSVAPTAATAGSLAGAVRRLEEPVDLKDPAELAALIENQPTPPIEEWKAGYRNAGGPEHLLSVFLRPGGIIACESGWPDRPDAATVISRTHDVGFVQANRAAHRGWVEKKWPDRTFTQSMQDPFRNGVFAAILALESGTGPWYMSRHCWT